MLIDIQFEKDVQQTEVEFDIEKYRDIAGKLKFGNQRKCTDAYCCFLPKYWRLSVDKDYNFDMLIIHAFLEVKENHRAINQGIILPGYEHLLEELEKKIDYEIEGEAFFACEELVFEFNGNDESGEIIFSCRNYKNRGYYSRDYPTHGTTCIEDRCFYENYSEECKLRKPSNELMDTPLKLYGFKSDIIHGLETFVVGGFSHNKIRYELIPSPIPPKPEFRIFRTKYGIRRMPFND